MEFKTENVYHPFTNSSLGIFLKEILAEDRFLGEAILDINLYYQPVQEPMIAFIFLCIKILLLFIGEYLYIKVYQLMKKEKGIIKNITQIFVCAQLTFWPFWICFAASTDFVHPLKELIGEWYCYGGSFLFYFLGHIITLHSFMSASMRYLFIIHREKVDEFGRERTKRLFFILSILIPLLVSIWEIFDGSDLDAMSFINKCHGKHHKVFLIDSSTMNVAKRNFCAFENYKINGFWSEVLALIRRTFCIANTIVELIMGLNIAEGILYFRILSHINR